MKVGFRRFVIAFTTDGEMLIKLNRLLSPARLSNIDYQFAGFEGNYYPMKFN